MSEMAIASTVIGIYLLGFWFTCILEGIIMGRESIWELDEMEIVCTLLWPIGLSIMLFACVCGLIDDFFEWLGATKVGRFIKKVLWYVTFPLRPFSIGYSVHKKIKEHERRKRLEAAHRRMEKEDGAEQKKDEDSEEISKMIKDVAEGNLS